MSPDPYFTSVTFTYDAVDRRATITDAAGLTTYAYDDAGRRTKVSGDLESDLGFTGHYLHQPSGLHLALYRAYDAGMGRWLNRDP